MRPAAGETWIVERWSRGSSPLHSLDARVKLAALVAYLFAIASTSAWRQSAFAGYAVVLSVAIAASRIPARALLARAALVLPFSATFAFITWLTGDGNRALALVEKSFLSGLAVLVAMSATPLAELARALESFRVPRSLVLVIQFLYRYLFVVTDQAHRMRMAAASRQGFRRNARPRFQAAAGAVGVLFARSWERADAVYRAMTARGFRGTFPVMAPARLRASDIMAAGCFALASLAVRLLL